MANIDKRTTPYTTSARQATFATVILLSLATHANSIVPLSQQPDSSDVLVSEYGSLSEFGSALLTAFAEHNNTGSQQRTSPSHVVYINAGEPLSESSLASIQNDLSKGAIIILDGTHNGDDTSDLSTRIGGIGFSSPILMIRQDASQKPEYKSLSFFNADTPISSLMEYTQYRHQKMADETYRMLEPWTAKQRFRAATPSTYRDNAVTYRPETTINVEIRHTGFPCMVGKEYNGNSVTGVSRWDADTIDACENKASVSLFYTVDFIRSVSTEEGGTEDAKYVRITLNPEGDGGAGWHFSEKPTHRNLWFQSQTNRIEWFGPIVEDYSVKLASRDPEIRLYQSVPENKPQHSHIVALPSIAIGVMLPGGVSIPADATLGLPLKFGSTVDRAVIYNNYEYAIINRSIDDSTATASWLWTREFDKYSDGWRTNRICSLWCSDPFFDDNAFTPAAYAHFSPGFSATFRASAEKMDQSTIKFTGSANVVALGGRVQYKFLLQHYAPWSRKGSTYTFVQNLRVNWGSTLFNPEIPVSIEAYRENSEMGLCLNITESDIDEGIGHVDLYHCHFQPNQIWGMDNDNRYKSRLAQDLCLTREDNDSLTVQQCTHAANQKWEWQNDKLVSKLGGYLTAIPDGSVSISDTDTGTLQWRSFLRKPTPSDVLSIQSIPISQTEFSNAPNSNQ